MAYKFHFKWLLFTTCLVAFSFNVFAQMYKQVDKDGNVTYTDTPDQPDAKHIKPPPMSTIPAPNLPPVDLNSSDSSETDQAEAQRSRVEYRSITIVSPENGGAIRANGGSFSVQIKLDPPLDTDSKHKIVVLMDGSIKAESQSTTVALQGIDRGEHSFTAQVLSGDGKILLSSGNVSFTVLRVSGG